MLIFKFDAFYSNPLDINALQFFMRKHFHNSRFDFGIQAITMNKIK